MRYRSPIVTYRWFIWGLSNGVFVLVIAGGFWFGLAASTVKPSPLLGLIIIFEIAILWAAVRLRRKARGFRLSEARHGDDVQRELRRELLVRFRRVAVAEGVAATVAVGLCVALNRMELMWAALGLVVSLHFAPLARIFRLWLYYGLATLGSLACILAMVSFTGVRRHQRPQRDARCDARRNNVVNSGLCNRPRRSSRRTSGGHIRLGVIEAARGAERIISLTECIDVLALQVRGCRSPGDEVPQRE